MRRVSGPVLQSVTGVVVDAVTVFGEWLVSPAGSISLILLWTAIALVTAYRYWSGVRTRKQAGLWGGKSLLWIGFFGMQLGDSSTVSSDLVVLLAGILTLSGLVVLGDSLRRYESASSEWTR
ncbi:hypothetical protein [Haloarchaeobius sp. DFWS5]|uniref:hypothetical protein n=1 Tax=Haloarchaeobius sp. DFWS5 TaxID=3446114 RepID=UPI003EC126C2